MGLNIVVGKIGRSTYFNRNKWKDAAGNNEFPILLSALARLNPENTYYFIGRSDLDRIEDEVYNEWFPNKNVINCWKGFNKKESDVTTWISKVLRHVHIDYGLIHGGMCSLSIPDRIYCLDRKTKKPNGDIRKPIQSLVNYVSPITYFLNERQIDWMSFTSDGRYMPLPARDMLNPEKISIGVRDGYTTVNRMKSYEDQETMIEHKVRLVYGFAEFQYLLDNKWNKPRVNEPKTQLVGLFFHEYKDKKRIAAIEDVAYSFNLGDVVVYGKWAEGRDMLRFKGAVPFDELQEILPSVKYTFCYPITPGDISGKWVEAVTNGIIPFFHETYDKDRLLMRYHGVPEFLYVKDGEEMRQKVEELENDPTKYLSIKEHLQSMVLREEYVNGTFINDLINNCFNSFDIL